MRLINSKQWKLFTVCTELVRPPYIEYAASGLPNPTRLEWDVRFIQAQDQQVLLQVYRLCIIQGKHKGIFVLQVLEPVSSKVVRSIFVVKSSYFHYFILALRSSYDEICLMKMTPDRMWHLFCESVLWAITVVGMCFFFFFFLFFFCTLIWFRVLF